MSDGRLTLRVFGGVGVPPTPATGRLTLYNDGTEFKVIDDTGTITTLQGPAGATGPAGTAGSKWYTAAGAPGSGLGVVGDFYLDSVAPNTFYEKTDGVTWTSQGTLQGATGPTGPAGGALAQQSVVDILSPTELNAVAGASEGDPIVAFQAVASGISLYGFYLWDASPSATENIPYRIDGSGGGQWVLNYGYAYDYLYRQQISTGIIEGLVVSINGGDASKVDISAGKIAIIDAYTDAQNPTLEIVSVSGAVALTLTNLATDDATFFTINSSGTIVQATSEPTQESLRDTPIIGAAFHPDNALVEAVSNRKGLIATPALSLSDLAEAIGPINTSGNVYDYDDQGNNLKLDKSVGTSFAFGANSSSPKNPHNTSDPALNQVSFRYIYQDGSGGLTIVAAATDVDATQYDDGSGTLQSVGSAQWTNQRIYYLPGAGITLIAFGQNTYGSQSAALAALETEAFTIDASINSFQFRAWLTVRGNATSNLNNSTLTAAGRFGAGQIATGTDTSTDIQQAYSNSADGQILTDSTRNALKIKEGSGVTELLKLLGSSDENRMTITPAGDASGTVMATQAEAEGDTNNTHLMTPLRNKQAHDDRLASTVTSVGATGVVGTGANIAREDHQHGHGNQAGGSLHANVIAGGASGFMTGADKTKLDGLSSGGFNPAVALQLYDDFITGNEDTDELGAYGWRINNTGTGNIVVRLTGVSGHPGIIRFSGGTGGSARAGMNLGVAGSSALVLGGGEITFEASIRYTGSPANQGIVIFGLGNNDVGGDQNNGVYFQFLDTDTNWFLVSANSATRTRVNTTTAVSSGTWVRFGFVVNSAGTSIQAYINGSPVGSPITTNIPSSGISPIIKADANGTIAATTDIDYYFLKQTLSR